MQRLNRDSVVAILLLVACGVFFWAYLLQSLRSGPAEPTPDSDSAPPGFAGFIAYWRNPIICFAMFFTFLATLPVLGMLIGGISFVFILMTLLGGWAPRQLLFHALVAIATVGGMWSLFTFGLGVMLPEGVIYNPFAA